MRVQVVDAAGQIRETFENTSAAVAWAHGNLAGDWDLQMHEADVVRQRAERGPVRVVE